MGKETMLDARVGDRVYVHPGFNNTKHSFLHSEFQAKVCEKFLPEAAVLLCRGMVLESPGRRELNRDS